MPIKLDIRIGLMDILKTNFLNFSFPIMQSVFIGKIPNTSEGQEEMLQSNTNYSLKC